MNAHKGALEKALTPFMLFNVRIETIPKNTPINLLH